MTFIPFFPCLKIILVKFTQVKVKPHFMACDCYTHATAVGVKDFSSPEKVVHIDRIFIKDTQPKVSVRKVALTYEDGSTKTIMENDRYLLFS